MSIFSQAGRYRRTLRHVKPGQMAWRLRSMLRAKLGLRSRVPWPAEAPIADPGALASLGDLLALWARRHPPDAERNQGFRAGAFTFLNHTEQTGGMPPWDSAGSQSLWRYQLHYFDFARMLAMAPREGDGALVLGWMKNWIGGNRPGAEVSWDPYPVSMRLINWAFAMAVFEIADEDILRSYAQQTAYLRRNLEYDILANHLLQSAVGLTVAGALIGGPCLGEGLGLLEREIGEQILPDGGHYERSPMYHALLLEGLLAAYAALSEKPGFLRDAIGRMAGFLEGICLSDGDIPLFGDSVLGAATPGPALAAMARKLTGDEAGAPPAGCYALRESGFYVLGPKDNSARMAVKAGPPGPPYQLGHAHCDLLSYELSIGAQRILTDSGVHGYAGSPYRGYCRSTRAHNTVSVNGMEQLECWSTFRVGGRCLPDVEKWDASLPSEMRAGHHGFAPFKHTRQVLFPGGQIWIVVDTVEGPGPVCLESYIHIAPGLHAEEGPESHRIEGGGVSVQILTQKACPAEGLFNDEISAEVVEGRKEPLQGWYCPEFGEALPAPVLVFQAIGSSRLALGYAIVNEGPGSDPAALSGAAQALHQAMEDRA